MAVRLGNSDRDKDAGNVRKAFYNPTSLGSWRTATAHCSLLGWEGRTSCRQIRRELVAMLATA